jgi:osmotically-inducible protein OsmY
MVKRLQAFAAIAAVMGSGAAAFGASDVKVYGGPPDKAITEAVKGRIAEYPNLQAPNEVRVQTRNKVVYLYGQVNNEEERNQAEALAAQVEGVRKVVDTISLSDGGG